MDRPDVVLVSIDTLRADHLGAYGYPRDTSPTLDALASAGATFLHARSASPWTLPSHATMLTGLLPTSHQVIEDGLALPSDTPRLAESFQAAGYRTGGFVSALYVSHLFGFDEGFERFEDFDIDSMKENLAQETDADDVVDAALAWWSEQPEGEPVFLFLHFYDVHYEYDPPGSYGAYFDRRPNRNDPAYKNYHYFQKHPLTPEAMSHQEAQYDEAIRYVDQQLLRLETATAGRDALWVVTSDHGEELGERGSWGHAHTLYAEQLHVPLIISGRGVKAQRVETVVGLQDLAPTLAHWVGASFDADGSDLAPTLRGHGDLPARTFVSDTSRFDTNRVGILSDSLRLEWDLESGRKELFDVRLDPQELHDLAQLLPEETAILSRAVGAAAGVRWLAKRGGVVETTGAIVLDGRTKQKHRVSAGEEIRIVPADAEVRFDGAGPWKAVGGEAPRAEDPLALPSPVTDVAKTVELDEATRAKLEALGYVQGD